MDKDKASKSSSNHLQVVDQKEEFDIPSRSRGVSHGTRIMKYIQDEHLNRYAFVHHRISNGWRARFLELNPDEKKISWWLTRQACGDEKCKPEGHIQLSEIKQIDFKPSKRTEKILGEIKKSEEKINEQQKQMQLIRKQHDFQEKIDEEKFVALMLKQYPNLLKVGFQGKATKEIQAKYGEWQNKRREKLHSEDVDFQGAANSFLDFKRGLEERLTKKTKPHKVIARLTRQLTAVNRDIIDDNRNLEDYRRILEASQKQYFKLKKKLCDRAKKSDYMLEIVQGKKKRKEKFKFKTPRSASHWKEYIEQDQLYEKPAQPENFASFDPDDCSDIEDSRTSKDQAESEKKTDGPPEYPEAGGSQADPAEQSSSEEG